MICFDKQIENMIKDGQRARYVAIVHLHVEDNGNFITEFQKVCKRVITAVVD